MTDKNTEDKSSLKKKVAKAVKKATTKKDEVAELKKQNIELNNDLLRARADYDNFRKRKEKEIMETRERAIVSFAEDLLPSIDNFEMSLKMTDNNEMFLKGVELIHKNLIDVLKDNKIEEFHARVGDEFNANLHEPILIEDQDSEPGKVAKVLQKGYMHKDKVIRSAKVQIPKEKEE